MIAGPTPGLGSGELLLRQMHNDLERASRRKLPRPTNDEFLGVLVEIFFAEREGSRLSKSCAVDSIRISIALTAVCACSLIDALRSEEKPDRAVILDGAFGKNVHLKNNSVLGWLKRIRDAVSG